MKNSKIHECKIVDDVSTCNSILRESRIGGISNIVNSEVCNCIINNCVIRNCTVKASVLRNAIIDGKECCVSLKLGQMACVPKVYKSYAVTIDNDRINMLFVSDKYVWEFDVCSPEELLIALKCHRVCYGPLPMIPNSSSCGVITILSMLSAQYWAEAKVAYINA